MVSMKYQDYCVSSNDVITVIFVHHKSHLLYPIRKFKPLMTHQIFDGEQIYGYHNLRIKIYIAAHSAYCYIKITHDDILRTSLKFALEPDNIMELLKPWFPNNLLTSASEFREHVRRNEDDYIFGECVDCFLNKNELNTSTAFRIINCNIESTGFRSFHERFQSLIILFIDAANFIDLKDPNWRILYLYEECWVNSKRKFCPVGFCSIYLVKGITTVGRISQFFIVPFLQRQGLGYKLLNAAYNYIKLTINDLEEITVESPNRIFTRMRDNYDVSLIFEDPRFKRELVLKGYSDDMLQAARLRYKLSNEQARKVYEILRCYWAQHNPKDFDQFMYDLKKHRRAQQLVKRYIAMAQKRSSNRLLPKLAYEDGVTDDSIEHDELLQEEADKFVSSIQMTLKYLENRYGN